MTVTEVAFSLPLFVMTMVYFRISPALTGSGWSVLVIVSTGLEWTVVVSVAEADTG